MARLKIGVIFGSRSTEHEVSIVTALQVMQELKKNHEVVPIYITKKGEWMTGQELFDPSTYKKEIHEIRSLSKLVINPDTQIQTAKLYKRFIFSLFKRENIDLGFPLVHGAHGEDGTIQGLLELSNIPYIGCDSICSGICIDKIITKYLLKGANLPTLDFYWFTRNSWENEEEFHISEIEKRFNDYPLVVKPARLGSSIGVAISRNVDELKYNISVASHFDNRILVEPFLANNQEINCSVLGYRDYLTSVCEQPVSSGNFLSYEDKYLNNSAEGFEGAKRIIPAPITKDIEGLIKRLSIEAFKTVGARGLIRIDFLIDKVNKNVYLNEINTIPGSMAFYLWEPLGISKNEILEKLIELAFQSYNDDNKIQYTTDTYLLEKIDVMGIKK